MSTLTSAPKRQGTLALWALVIEIAVVGFALVLLLEQASSHITPTISDYSIWNGNITAVGPFLLWMLSATTEPNFYSSALAGVGLLAGGTIAHALFRRNSKWHGYIQACGSGDWTWVVASALLGVLASNLLWGWTLESTNTWQPLFVPFVSVSPTVVLMFGPTVKNVLTGAGLGALTTTPLSLAGTNYICEPLGIPPVVGVTGGMAVGALVAFAICRVLPWMPAPVHLRQQQPPSPPPTDRPAAHGARWTLRRTIADFSEAQFFGNEWASAGLVLGAIAAYLLNPASLAYGSGLLPQILVAQLITASAAIVLWRKQWSSRPFYPTFVPVVSVAPATVLAFGGSVQAILAGALLGAAVAPPVAAAIARRLPSDFHPFIGNVASMALSTAIIVPALGLAPGFTS
ncbi:hypothetical protein [Rhodococcus jostii]|uniref:Uncharacterized protein n=1 Tax=Rhodococcus jostii TaxID=132919 RepID=A0A1H4TJH0_RHOJO|nr:hypothetical protein [Rhodococcus jostii]SEC56646.1 hypothetical protein SAMN04490220_1970 [Rhodococcus jostii]